MNNKRKRAKINNNEKQDWKKTKKKEKSEQNIYCPISWGSRIHRLYIYIYI